MRIRTIRPSQVVTVVLTLSMWATSAAAVTPEEGALLTSLVATAAAKDARVDVLTAGDLRKAVDVEAEKSLVGCNASSCLAEVAAAMDAAAVLHGSIGALGDDVILNLNLFDSNTATAVGRARAKGKTVSQIGDAVDGAMVEVLKNVPAVKDGKRVRVLVLDLDVVGSPSPPPPEKPMPLLSGVGVGVAALGAIGVVVAAGCEQIVIEANTTLSNKPTTTVAQAQRAESDRGYAIAIGQWAWPVGIGLVAVGAGLAAVPLVVGE
jgi:hypothetical protein